MSKSCERPGCSNPGEAAYGMVPEDLLFWIEPLAGHPADTANVLCRRHADSMVVPRGWTLDDRRSGSGPRLFQPARFATAPVAAPDTPAPRRQRRSTARAEQLQIDGTGEIHRPVLPADDVEPAATEAVTPAPVAVPEHARADGVADAAATPAQLADAPAAAVAPGTGQLPVGTPGDGIAGPVAGGQVAALPADPGAADAPVVEAPAVSDADRLAAAGEPDAEATPDRPTGSWRPEFTTDDDLGGLLNVSSPLLARAFRGTDLPR